MNRVYYNEDYITILDCIKKVDEMTLEDVDRLYRNKIITLLKFITDDNYFIKLEEEKEEC